MARKRSEIGATGYYVAQIVRRRREELGLTHVELSRRLTAAGRAIPAPGLARIEARARRVDVDDLYALAQVLGFDPTRTGMPIIDGCGTEAPARSRARAYVQALGRH